ncbi:hypothetical protein PS659_01242 [Pseudomonas fluorescens]|uniref:Uncharacterized protein n=1 Tax=Pseudomonas fluorescens TaxID=294 RepID=A0A5E6QWL8_PSEFL|nr:hypothetical protein PS659_01242 [Pseudomonas fluorescens]
MRRDLNKVRHLLTLIEACPDHMGIHRERLADKWIESGTTANPLGWDEYSYLLDRSLEAGLISIRTGSVLLTWEGHDWLDRNRTMNF